MTQGYIGILFLGIAAIANAGLILVVSGLAARLTGSSRPTLAKAAPYESGMPPLGDTRERFSVKFYITAMLFIIFDIETVFLIPWAVSFRELGLYGLVIMLIFLAVLTAGLVYAWKKGALEWS